MLRALAVLLAACALLAGAAAYGWTQRIAIAEWWLQRRVAQMGIAPASLDVTSVGVAGATVESIALGAPDAPDLTAARVEVEWSWPGLREGRFDALRIEGVRVRAAVDAENRLSLGALDPLLAGEGALDATPVLPAPEIALEDAQLRISTPKGVAEGTLAGALHEEGDGIGGTFTLRASGGGLRVQGALDVAGTLAAPAFRASLEPEGEGPITGRIDVRGALAQADGARSFQATAALRDVAVALGALRVAGIHGTVALAGPPLHTPPAQLLSFARVDAGVALTNGLVSFALRRDGTLAIERISLAFAGGELYAENVRIDPSQQRLPVTLRAKALDLAVLLGQVSLPGLRGSGRLDGELPVVRDGDQLVVTGGILRNADAGTIQYEPSDSVRSLAESRPADLGLAVEAFEDFHYEVLEARVDGDLAGEMVIGLRVRGVNPDFQDGRPVDLNLNLEAHVADLVRAGASSYRVPQVIEERLRAFSEGK
ncbi:MAG: hypothetical protein DCC71_13975 [Proteobacteria bacterium]|nr:MAG: hypothetical protein DCC71_13975 [Pseudomonadota bacterium]